MYHDSVISGIVPFYREGFCGRCCLRDAEGFGRKSPVPELTKSAQGFCLCANFVGDDGLL